jgi:hypothetical protein
VIQVNLLPPEHRVKDRAPVSRLLGLVAALLVTFLAMGVYVYAKAIMVRGVTVRRDDAKARKELDMVRAKVYDDLEREVKAYKTREDKIDEIAKTDTRYAPLLYSATKMLWDAEQDQQQGFKAWYSSMSLAQVKASGRSRSKGDVPEFKVRVATATDDGSRVSNFYRAIKAHDYFRTWYDLDTINPPKASKIDYQQYEPNSAIQFEVKLQSFAADELLKRIDQIAKAAAGAGGDGKAPAGGGKAPAGDGKAPAGGKQG